MYQDGKVYLGKAGSEKMYILPQMKIFVPWGLILRTTLMFIGVLLACGIAYPIGCLVM